MLTNPITAKPKQAPSLMTILNFNPGDLGANKAGQLSKRQLRIAEASQPNLVVQLVLMGHVVFIMGVLVVIVLASGVTGEKLLLLGLASLVILSPFLYAMDRLSAIKKGGLSPEDLAGGEVLQICGELTIIPPTINIAKIKIATMVFVVPKGALDLLDPDKPYCVYYAPHSKMLLSLEEITI